jgi:AcrR family transcriptional regulator
VSEAALHERAATARERVLAAVGELVRSEPWADVTMGEVATAAGLSRQTLYNEFGSRDALAQAYVLAEADRMIAGVAEVVRQHDDPRAALRAAFESFLAEAERHPVLIAVSSAEGNDELLALITARGGPLLVEVTRVLAPALRENWPFLSDRDVELVVETMLRLAISHATLPSGTPSATAAAIARVLGPFLDELEAIRR